MQEITIFCDLHGVLINSELMIKNYEKVLINLFGNYHIASDIAITYHNEGLTLYKNLLQELKNESLSGNEFLLEMDRADKKWDKLMQNFVPKSNPLEIESRNVEYLAGSFSNTFYDDGKKFLQAIQDFSSNNLKINYFLISNSHSKHMEGLLRGAGFKNVPNEKILGWDKIKALKNNRVYYKNLWTLKSGISRTNIIIGNSKDEMVLGKEEGFKTIFVKREFSRNFDFEEYVDVLVDDLEVILPKIKKEFLQDQ